MIEHCKGDIPGLLSGELTRTEMSAVASHLRSCEQCREALVDLSIAHGSLKTVRRHLTMTDTAAETPDRPLPTLVVERKVPKWILRSAAAVVLVVGLGIAGLSFANRAPVTPVAATAKLASLDAPVASQGKVVVRATSGGLDMVVATSGLPKISANQYYEVWLLNPKTNKMLPVGMLKPNGVGDFTFSKQLMDDFSAVDISLQANDGVAAHSAISMLRGPVHLT